MASISHSTFEFQYIGHSGAAHCTHLVQHFLVDILETEAIKGSNGLHCTLVLSLSPSSKLCTPDLILTIKRTATSPGSKDYQQNKIEMFRGRPFDSWGSAMLFCEKMIFQQIIENK